MRNKWIRGLLGVVLSAVFVMAPGVQAAEARDENGCIYSSENLPVITAEHPRVYVNAELLPEIRQRVSNPNYQLAWSTLKKYSEVDTDGKFDTNVAEGSSNFSYTMVQVISSCSARYLLEQNEAYGRKAAEVTLNALETYIHASIKRDVGDLLNAAAMAYDWCYDMFTPVQRQWMINKFIELTKVNLGSWPPSDLNSVTGHSSEQHLLRDSIAIGLAIYDEYPEYFNEVASVFFDEYVPAREFINQSYAYQQGQGYGPFRTQFDMCAQFLFDRAGFSNVFSEDLRQLPYNMLYYATPDGHMMRDGDMNDQIFGKMFLQYPHTLIYTASYYRDGYLMDAAYKIKYEDGQNLLERMSTGSRCVEFLLLVDDSIERKPIEELPLTRFTNSPVGGMIARTSWETGLDSKTVVAEVKIGDYFFSNHSHSDAGKFGLYYKGSLAQDTGIYQGTDGMYFSNHDKSYNKRSIAHNTILVYDPDEDSWGSGYANDGGQTIADWRTEPRTVDILKEGYHVAQTLNQYAGPDKNTPEFSYIKGDITDAYSSSKMEECIRSAVFVPFDDGEIPGALIVYDKVVTTKPEYEKYWLLHSSFEPEISGNVTTVKMENAGYDGKLVNTTLIPEQSNAVLEKVHGYDVMGTEYPNSINGDKNSSIEADSWRVQVSPRKDNSKDYFLNVMQVMDASGDAVPYDLKRIENDTVQGVQIHDKIVLFSRETSCITNTFSFRVDQPGDYKILITDLEAGDWFVSKDGTLLYNLSVSSGEGAVSFPGEAGEYQLNRGHSAEAGTAVFRERTLRSSENTKSLVMNYNTVPLDTSIVRMSCETTYVPLRSLVSKLNGTIQYDESSRKVTAETEFSDMELTIGSTEARLNGETVLLKNPLLLKDGYTMIELQDCAALLGGTGWWFDYANAVYMNVPQTPEDQWRILSAEGENYQTDCEPAKSIDQDYTTRWTANGDGVFAVYDLGESRTLSGFGTAWHQGAARVMTYKVYTSEDKENWSLIFDGQSSGKTAALEKIMLEQPAQGRYLKVEGWGNSANKWCNLSEFVVYK